MAKKFIEGTELVQAGFANGISTQLAKKQLTDDAKKAILS